MYTNIHRGDCRGREYPCREYPETEKCCKKWLFSKTVKNDRGPGRTNKKSVKNQFYLYTEIFLRKFKIFHNYFKS